MAFRIGVTQGMSGFFAVMYDIETHEPYATGVGRYPMWDLAAKEARAWQEAEGESVELEVSCKKIIPA